MGAAKTPTEEGAIIAPADAPTNGRRSGESDPAAPPGAAAADALGHHSTRVAAARAEAVQAGGAEQAPEGPHGEREVTQGFDPDERLLTPGEVAAAFGVNAKTVARWSKAGKLPSVRTLGGHRRYRRADIAAAAQAAARS